MVNMGFIYMKIIKKAIILFLPLLLLAACNGRQQNESPPGQTGKSPEMAGQASEPGQPELSGQPGQPSDPDKPTSELPSILDDASEYDDWPIRVVNPSAQELWSFTASELAGLAPEKTEPFIHAYSTINNWPSERFLVAAGYSVESILKLAGVFDSAQTLTFRAEDGYEVSLTRQQLLKEQYYYPNVGQNGDGAEPVVPIIAYRLREGTSDTSQLRAEKPALIFGQSYPFEHTNPAFVERVAEIVVDDSPCESWEPASTFPLPGQIAEGETVKLQHASIGLVKLHYTLDGSDPTPLSKMYNPSTYQPELNVPIPITEPVTIKVLVTGFGKNDSEIAEFEFLPIS